LCTDAPYENPFQQSVDASSVSWHVFELHEVIFTSAHRAWDQRLGAIWIHSLVRMWWIPEPSVAWSMDGGWSREHLSIAAHLT
jgi:hypothetical protein